MDIPYGNMLDLTWMEFDYISRGYEQRMQRSWDFVRNIMATQFNSSGFSKKKWKARDIMTLPYIDEPDIGKTVERMSEETFERMKSYLKN